MKTPDDTPSKNVGKLYTLQEALEFSLLTLDDIKQISNYQNNHLIFEKPNDDISNKIRETKAAELQAEYPNATIDDVSIWKYFGEYNGCYAVMLSDSFHGYIDVLCTEVVGVIEIRYGNANTIFVWSDKPVKTAEK